MKYWRWKCQPCGREITIAAGVVPKPCHICSAWDFLKLGETDDKHELPQNCAFSSCVRYARNLPVG
jgi:hypothetical protein